MGLILPLFYSMFSLEQNLTKLLWTTHPKTVLDLGTGNGDFSVLCASYGCDVVAIDFQKQKNWIYPEYLVSHPHIQFFNADITETDHLSFHQTYDLILLFNVIVFLEKQTFLDTLLPFYLGCLTMWGKLCLTFFFADDETMSAHQNLSFYTFKDFILPMWYKVVVQQDEMMEDCHKPLGKHLHHIWYMEIEKIL